MKIDNFFRKFFLSFCITLPAFSALHWYNEYFGLLSFTAVIVHFPIYSTLFYLIYLSCRKFFPQPGNAATYTLMLMIAFFFFGIFHTTIKKIQFLSFFASYSVLLPLLGILAVTYFFFLRRKKIFLEKKLLFFNLLFFAFFSFEILHLFLNAFIIDHEKNNFSSKFSGLPDSSHLATSSSPDIYFVVFDTYTSSVCLKEEFNFDNSRFDSSLQSHNFFISRHSKSNYNFTPFSIASTFNLNYMREDLGREKMTFKLILQASNTLKYSWLPQFFRHQGYSIKNFSWFPLNHYPIDGMWAFETFNVNINSEPTLFGCIRKDIWWNVEKSDFLRKMHIIPDFSGSYKKRYLEKDISIYNNLIRELQFSESSPKFVFCHLMLPHEPFFYDKEGRMVPDFDSPSNVAAIRDLYLGQLQYANSLIEKLLPYIRQNSSRPRVVILEGDHGFRDSRLIADKNDSFKNLNAYYFSDGDYSGLYDGISPVNSFRVVLNKYFNQHFELLPDKSFFIQESDEAGEH